MTERERLIKVARDLGLRAFDSGGNFFALDVSDFPGGPEGFATAILEQGVIIRVMSGILRITVGTPQENEVLIKALKTVVGVSNS